jgi:hypothetical protein
MTFLEQLARQRLEGSLEAPPDDGVRENCPHLWEMLTTAVYDDKERTKRILPEIVVGRESGGYSVTLKDHETCQQKVTFALRWEEIPLAIEMALTDTTKPWYPFRSFKNKQGEGKIRKFLTGSNGHG